MSLRFGFANIGRQANIEKIVRKWVAVDSFSRIRTEAVELGPQPEAFIRWGGTSQFTVQNSQDFRTVAKEPGRSFDVTSPDDDDPRSSRVRHVYNEEGRGFVDFAVTSPEDINQYIIVRLVTTLAMRGPNGEQVTFALTPQNGHPGDEVGEGIEPPDGFSN